MFGGQEIVIVVIVIALIFGASRLPLLGRNFGQGIKEFRKGVKEIREDDDAKSSSKDTTQTASPDATQNGAAPSDDVTAKRRD